MIQWTNPRANPYTYPRANPTLAVTLTLGLTLTLTKVWFRAKYIIGLTVHTLHFPNVYMGDSIWYNLG